MGDFPFALSDAVRWAFLMLVAICFLLGAAVGSLVTWLVLR